MAEFSEKDSHYNTGELIVPPEDALNQHYTFCLANEDDDGPRRKPAKYKPQKKKKQLLKKNLASRPKLQSRTGNADFILHS